MKTERALCLLMSIALLACADTSTKVETETHFLQSCESSCEDGLSCICGVCTTQCSDEAQCAELSGSASCAPIPSSCGHVATMTCDVTCTRRADCAALGADYTCASGRCRAESDAGSGGSGGAGGAGGDGASGNSGEGGAGGNGGQGGAVDAGGPVEAGIDAGGFDAGVDASADGDCDAVGDPCCDPFPGDGPNYCSDMQLTCGANNTCELNCECPLPAYIPVCGVDGQTYNAVCSMACIPVEIACDGECPCAPGVCTYGCTGAAPDQEVIDACDAITEMSECASYLTGGIPSGCRWVTSSTEPCPLVPGMP